MQIYHVHKCGEENVQDVEKSPSPDRLVTFFHQFFSDLSGLHTSPCIGDQLNQCPKWCTSISGSTATGFCKANT